MLRLFFGGFYPIKLENLRLIETKQNFQQFIDPLWYFDAMITGGTLEDIKIRKEDVLIIKHLINDSLNRNNNKKTTTSTTFDKYIYDTFA